MRPTGDSQQLHLLGKRLSGSEARDYNVQAAETISGLMKTSLGPMGLDKMLVTETGDTLTTNDGATILANYPVEHPAAKILVGLAERQDKEVGDGTTGVVIVACELLKRGNDLIKKKLHPRIVIKGFDMACAEAVRFIESHLAVPRDAMGVDERESLMRIARTSMSSKILRANGDFFASMAVDAILSVRHEANGKTKCSVGNVQVLKQQGASALESIFIHGFALNCTRKSQQMPRTVKNAKIALLDFDLKRFRAAMGIELRAKTVQDIENFDEYEQVHCKKLIERIVSTGANVVLTTKGIDDLAEKYLSEAGIFGVARIDKRDMAKIAKMTGGKMVLTPPYEDNSEDVQSIVLGAAAEVAQERLGDDELIFIRVSEDIAVHSRVCSIVLRGANEVFLDEMERSLHDVLCVLRDVVQTDTVVPGGGCVEAALAVHLENLATTIESKEQLAIAAFADALLVIPKQLSINAGKDATDLVTKLTACHHMAQSMPDKKDLRFTGLDLFEGTVANNLRAGVLEPAMSKVKSLQIATTAANNILRIDDFFSFKQDQQHHGGY